MLALLCICPDVVRAYKSVLKEKEALEASLKALSLTQSPQKHLTPRRPRSRGLEPNQIKEGSFERSGESDTGLRSESDTDAAGAPGDADKHMAEVCSTGFNIRMYVHVDVDSLNVYVCTYFLL